MGHTSNKQVSSKDNTMTISWHKRPTAKQLLAAADSNNCKQVADILKSSKRSKYLLKVRTTDEGDHVIHLLTKHRCYQCCTLILKRDPHSVYVQNIVGLTPLMLASERNDLQLCTLFMEQAKKLAELTTCLTQITTLGETPLHIATGCAHYYDHQCPRLLLEYDVDINCQTNAGLTPLHLLVYQPETPDHYTDTLILFINNGADANIPGTYEDVYRGAPITPFHLSLLLLNITAIAIFTECGLYTHKDLKNLTENKTFGSIYKNEQFIKVKMYIEEKLRGRTLKSLCRTAVRKAIVSCKQLEELRTELPQVMISYLGYGDVKECLPEINDNLRQC